jgi:hypothetical protein
MELENRMDMPKDQTFVLDGLPEGLKELTGRYESLDALRTALGEVDHVEDLAFNVGWSYSPLDARTNPDTLHVIGKDPDYKLGRQVRPGEFHDYGRISLE